MVKTIALGAPSTAFLRFGDSGAIAMVDASSAGIFGRIEQIVLPYPGTPSTP